MRRLSLADAIWHFTLVTFPQKWHNNSMELFPKRKILLFALATCIVFSVILSVILTTTSHDHDCKGEGCPICHQIEKVNNNLKTFKLAGFYMYISAFLLNRFAIFSKYSEFTFYLYSPIAIKVRFNS
jgi:hypothetical protein